VSDATISAADSALVTVRGHGPAPRQFWTKRLAADSSLIPTLLAAGVEFGVLRQSMLSVLVRCVRRVVNTWLDTWLDIDRIGLNTLGGSCVALVSSFIPLEWKLLT
jgi:hypothetical protein